MNTTKKHTSLAFFNDNTKKAFRSLLEQLKRAELTVIEAIDAEGDRLPVTKDTDVLDIMDHSFATETYSLIVKHDCARATIYGHLDGCIESMFANWAFGRGGEYIEHLIEDACDKFNDINEDLDLS